MNDSNLGIEQPSRPSTNQNSIHSPQSNGDVVSGRRELVGRLFPSAEFLLSACGDGASTKFKNCNSRKCILANSLMNRDNKSAS